MIIDVTSDVIKENLMWYGNTMHQQWNGLSCSNIWRERIVWTHVLCKQVGVLFANIHVMHANYKKLPLISREGKKPRFFCTFGETLKWKWNLQPLYWTKTKLTFYILVVEKVHYSIVNCPHLCLFLIYNMIGLRSFVRNCCLNLNQAGM